MDEDQKRELRIEALRQAAGYRAEDDPAGTVVRVADTFYRWLADGRVPR